MGPELKGVPQPPKKHAPVFRKRGSVGARKKTGSTRLRFGARSGRLGARRGSGSLLAKLFKRILAKAGVRRPTMRDLFRKKSVGDGRNHAFTGVKKRNGRTGLAGR